MSKERRMTDLFSDIDDFRNEETGEFHSDYHRNTWWKNADKITDKFSEENDIDNFNEWCQQFNVCNRYNQ